MIEIEQIDYSAFVPYVKGLIFLQFIWGTNYGPPVPVSSIQNLHAIMDYVTPMVPSDMILIGKPILAFDWELPYSPRNQGANSLTLDAAIALASDFGATIQFDETSMTPYYYYIVNRTGLEVEHIVWSIDARSIDVLADLIQEYALSGVGAWNVMVFYQQFWTIIITRFDIIKFIPDSFQ